MSLLGTFYSLFLQLFSVNICKQIYWFNMTINREKTSLNPLPKHRHPTQPPSCYLTDKPACFAVLCTTLLLHAPHWLPLPFNSRATGTGKSATPATIQLDSKLWQVLFFTDVCNNLAANHEISKYHYQYACILMVFKTSLTRIWVVLPLSETNKKSMITCHGLAVI